MPGGSSTSCFSPARTSTRGSSSWGTHATPTSPAILRAALPSGTRYLASLLGVPRLLLRHARQVRPARGRGFRESVHRPRRVPALRQRGRTALPISSPRSAEYRCSRHRSWGPRSAASRPPAFHLSFRGVEQRHEIVVGAMVRLRSSRYKEKSLCCASFVPSPTTGLQARPRGADLGGRTHRPTPPATRGRRCERRQ